MYYMCEAVTTCTQLTYFWGKVQLSQVHHHEGFGLERRGMQRGKFTLKREGSCREVSSHEVYSDHLQMSMIYIGRWTSQIRFVVFHDQNVQGNPATHFHQSQCLQQKLYQFSCLQH